MQTKMTMIYWKGEKFWLGKLFEHPEIMTQGESLKELNLDNFPMPRRDLLENNKYIYLGARVAQLETSRGCPHSCKFCCIVKMWKDPTQHVAYRSKSTSRIMREIYDVNSKNDLIFFCEDNFTIQVKRTKKILKTIITNSINKIIPAVFC